MTQGEPLQSTVSVLYFMYEEGFKWWSLGRAAAIAFLLFALILAATALLLAPRSAPGRRMKPRLAMAIVNGLLIAAACWRCSRCCGCCRRRSCSRATSSTFPPPLLPRHPTLANYRELFVRAGMARYLLNSLVIAGAITALSLAFNLAAGYAFAKLRFAGRERLFQGLLGALVIPAQVAMIPLFLIMKGLHLVNT